MTFRLQEQCIDVLKIVKSRINSQHEDISSHLLLSIFKIAEVDVVYPAPPSSAVSLRPMKYLYIIIIVITFLYHIQQSTKTLSGFTLINNIVNRVSTLVNKPNGPSSQLDAVSYINTFLFNNLINFMKALNKFDDVIDVYVISVVNEEHDARALENAQNEHITKTYISVLDVNSFNETKHIMNAVSITIYDDLNEPFAGAIILKYFSRDVFYEIGCCSEDPEKLVDELCFEKIASSSCGIIKSVSLELTIVVV